MEVYKNPLFFVIIFTTLALTIIRLRINALTNDLKPSWLLLFSHLLIATSIFVFSSEKSGSNVVFLFFTIAIFSANMLQLIEKSVMREIVVSIFGLLTFLVYFL